MGSSKKATTGYRYYMGLHFGICHGPVDEVSKVVVGEREAWPYPGAASLGTGTVIDQIFTGLIGAITLATGSTDPKTASGPITVYAPQLFGGDSREGGIVGTLDIAMGESTQVENAYLQSKLGAGIPAFRGILSAIWRGGQVASNNPYVKPWAFRVKRILQGWSTGSAWYPEKAPIVFREGSVGNANVKLVTRFEGASTADLSQSSLGAGTITYPTGVSVGNGSVRFGVTGVQQSTTYCALRWSSTELSAKQNGVQTWEFIFAVSINPETYVSQQITIARIDIGNGADLGESARYIYVQINGSLGISWPDRHKLHLQTASIGLFDSPGPVLVEDGMTTFHVAFTRKTESKTLDVFFNGTRVATGVSWNYAGESISAGSVAVELDPYNPLWDIKCLGLRVTAAELYGATYTVPTPEELTADFSSIVSDVVGMNPAHIIYQCLTDTSWGMGYPTTAIDSDTFTAAADALFSENFGLSMLWNRQETIEAFVQLVLDHIGGMLYVKPDTGAFALKLIRSDYIRDSLPQYGQTNLIAAADYQRQAWGETINEISVAYTDHNTGKDVSVTVQDTSNIMTQSGVVAQTRAYPGIPWPPLAQRVALRDLNSASTPLARVKLTATRAAWSVFPGDVFRLTWPEFDIADVVYRVLSVNRGTLQDGQIIIDAVEDVFGLPDNTYLVDQGGLWEDPSNEPAVAPYQALLEAPYWDLVRNLSAADMDYVDSLSGYLETLAVRPSSDAINYSVYTKVGAADYEQGGNGDFCPSATVVEALTKTTTAITLANAVDLDLFEVGGYAVIDSEYVLVSAIDVTALTATISRGVLDTVPVAHVASSRIWFADAFQGFETTEYADGETVDVKLLPITGRGELPLADAPVNSLTFDQRQYRPYPPAKVRFDTLEWPVIIEGSTDVVLTWAHRDRLSQTAYIVEQDEESIGPEASVTYSVEVADEALTVLYSATGITAATATIPATSLTAGFLRFRLWSMRGGLSSIQIHEHWAMWGGEIRFTEDGEQRITEDGETRVTN